MTRASSAACVLFAMSLAACAPLGGAVRSSSLVGVWSAEVSLLDCASGQATPAPPFRALVVFHGDGTLSEASGPSVRRTPSFGAWSASGANEYKATSQLLTYDANGAYSGSQEIRRTIRVAPDGKSFVADTRTVATDASGAVVFRGCARGRAQRIE